MGRDLVAGTVACNPHSKAQGVQQAIIKAGIRALRAKFRTRVFQEKDFGWKPWGDIGNGAKIEMRFVRII